DLLYPPNVKGWDGGETWINTTTLLVRYNLAGYLVGGKIPDSGKPVKGQGKGQRFRLERFDPPQNKLGVIVGADIAADANRLVDALIGRLLQTKLDDAARTWLVEQAERTHASDRPVVVAHLIM